MPINELRDRDAIRAILNQDRGWSVYAIGDLADGFFEHCLWLECDGSIAMVYEGFTTPVLFTAGTPEAIATLLPHLPVEHEMYLHVQADLLPLLEKRFRLLRISRMWRMVLSDEHAHKSFAGGADRMTASDVPAIQRLYFDGEASGEAPDFFADGMVTDGVFYGVRDDEDVVSVAGTHLVSPQEGIAALGNIYTRSDCRGRGLATRTTSAVVSEVLGSGATTVALNVKQSNEAAIRIYERLGFTRYRQYCEGLISV